MQEKSKSMTNKIISLWLFINYFLAGATAQSDGKIISKEKISYPAYHKVQGIDMYYDSATYAIAVHDKSVQTEKIFYEILLRLSS